MSIRLAVVVPVFNEGAGILFSIRAILKSVREIPNAKLVVVNDGSKDETLSILIAEVKKNGNEFSIVDLPDNRGYGGAILAGYKYSSEFASHVLFMDSDLTNSPDDIRRFYDLIIEGFDYIKASRFDLGGGMTGVPVFRLIHSKLASLISRLLFGVPISDPTNGFRAIRVGLIDYAAIKSLGFSSIMEELYLVSNVPGVKWSNLPVILTCRRDHQVKSSFIYSFQTYKEYLRPALKKLKERLNNVFKL
jgi:dolichol-phosphate mannosyltransferase